MARDASNTLTRLVTGHRLYWLLAIPCLVVPALVAYSFFPIGCRCAYGASTEEAFTTGMYVIWGRLALGFVLGEQRLKIIIYLAMPFLVAFIVTIVGLFVWPGAH